MDRQIAFINIANFLESAMREDSSSRKRCRQALIAGEMQFAILAKLRVRNIATELTSMNKL